RIGISPFRFGPFVVENKYHVSPSFAMEGSCVYSTSPETLITWGLAAGRVCPTTPAVIGNKVSQHTSPRTLRWLPSGWNIGVPVPQILAGVRTISTEHLAWRATNSATLPS